MLETTRDLHVFVVEDDKVFSSVICNHLNELRSDFADRGVTISYSTYYSGEEAIYDLRKDPDLIFLDHFLYNDGLDAADGLQILKKVKTYNEQIPVVIVSGQDDPAVAEELKKNGASGYLAKGPRTIDAMKGILSDLVDGKLVN